MQSEDIEFPPRRTSAKQRTSSPSLPRWEHRLRNQARFCHRIQEVQPSCTARKTHKGGPLHKSRSSTTQRAPNSELLCSSLHADNALMPGTTSEAARNAESAQHGNDPKRCEGDRCDSKRKRRRDSTTMWCSSKTRGQSITPERQQSKAVPVFTILEADCQRTSQIRYEPQTRCLSYHRWLRHLRLLPDVLDDTVRTAGFFNRHLIRPSSQHTLSCLYSPHASWITSPRLRFDHNSARPVATTCRMARMPHNSGPTRTSRQFTPSEQAHVQTAGIPALTWGKCVLTSLGNAGEMRSGLS